MIAELRAWPGGGASDEINLPIDCKFSGKKSDLGALELQTVQREAVREMLAFVERNRVRLEGVMVKELIHEGHRL